MKKPKTLTLWAAWSPELGYLPRGGEPVLFRKKAHALRACRHPIRVRLVPVEGKR